MPNLIKKYKKIEFIFAFYFIFSILFYLLYRFDLIDLAYIKSIINNLGPISFIFLGIMYTLAFLSPIIAVIFIFYAGTMPFYEIAILAGLGIAIADLLVYKIFEYKISDEIKELENTKLIKYFRKYKIFKDKLFMTFLGFIFIASPLPDSIGIMMIEEERILKTKYFFIIDLVLNIIAVYFFLSL